MLYEIPPNSKNITPIPEKASIMGLIKTMDDHPIKRKIII